MKSFGHVENLPEVYFTRNLFVCYRDSTLNVEYERFRNKIRVCVNKILSPEDLKGAIAREIV